MPHNAISWVVGHTTVGTYKVAMDDTQAGAHVILASAPAAITFK